MDIGPGFMAVVTLGLVACAGTQGGVSTTGGDPAAIRISPAGVGTLVFMDLESVGPSALTGSTPLPGCVTSSGPVAGVTTLTFNNCTAANGGVMTGTIAVTPVTGGLNEVFNVTVTTATSTVHQVWTYTGLQAVTVNGTSATLESGNITAVLVDSNHPANDATYGFSANLSAAWTGAPTLSLWGTYTFTKSDQAETVTATIPQATALTWNPALCASYPASGAFSLAFRSTTYGSDTIPVNFNVGCGKVSISGGTLALGGN